MIFNDMIFFHDISKNVRGNTKIYLVCLQFDRNRNPCLLYVYIEIQF